MEPEVQRLLILYKFSTQIFPNGQVNKYIEMQHTKVMKHTTDFKRCKLMKAYGAKSLYASCKLLLCYSDLDVHAV